MNETDQRIAIMEELGWLHIEDRSESLMMPKGTCLVGYPPKGAIVGKKQELPDPLHDLNVMREALRTLKDQQYKEFAMRLYRVLNLSDWNMSWSNWFKMATASADELAEAFLRVTGKWKD